MLKQLIVYCPVKAQQRGREIIQSEHSKSGQDKKPMTAHHVSLVNDLSSREEFLFDDQLTRVQKSKLIVIEEIKWLLIYIYQ